MSHHKKPNHTTRRWALIAFCGLAIFGGNYASKAAIGNFQTPTEMTISVNRTAALRGQDKVTVKTRLIRVDTGRPVSSALVTFYFGSPRFPNSRVGSDYTNANGEATVTFTVSQWVGLGRNLILAEFTGNNTFAQPLPYTPINVTNRW